MTDNSTNKSMTGLTEAACSVLFCTFCLLFLLGWQTDLLAVAQHYYSQGLTYYMPVLGAIIITAVLWLLQLIVARIFRGGLSCIPSLTFWPSAFVLTALTAVRETDGGALTYGSWPLMLGLLLGAFVLVGIFAGQWLAEVSLSWQRRGSTATLLGNGIILFLAMLFVCAGCNSDRLYHTRIHVEQCLSSDRLDEAMATIGSSDAHPALTMLTAYTLAAQGQLGERLFRYEPVGGSAALLPDSSAARLVIMPQSKFYRLLSRRRVVRTKEPKDFLLWLNSCPIRTQASADYLLCAYLLDKDLDAFVSHLPRFYAVGDSLPMHYKEALTLYRHSRTNPKILFSSSVMDTDFQDYQHLGAEKADERERKNALRDTYGGTYWYYYEYGGRLE